MSRCASWDVWVQGFDIAQGATLVKESERIGAGEIGLLATIGVSHVKVKSLQYPT
jgi:molybdopterin biosynthesis enzyme